MYREQILDLVGEPRATRQKMVNRLTQQAMVHLLSAPGGAFAEPIVADKRSTNSSQQWVASQGQNHEDGCKESVQAQDRAHFEIVPEVSVGPFREGPDRNHTSCGEPGIPQIAQG